MNKLFSTFCILFSFFLVSCSNDSSGNSNPGVTQQNNPPNSNANLPRCEAYKKAVSCLVTSMNHFTNETFNISWILKVRQNNDRSLATSDDGHIKLIFKSPVDIPNGNFEDIKNEISFVAEKGNSVLFEYTSLTWNDPYYGPYFNNNYYSVKYNGKSFSFSAIDNNGSVTCDNGESYTIENLKDANSECQSGPNPYLFDLPRFRVTTFSADLNHSCGMDFWIRDNDQISFRGVAFLSVQKPIAEACQ